MDPFAVFDIKKAFLIFLLRNGIAFVLFFREERIFIFFPVK
jgi:hypothetical protein